MKSWPNIKKNENFIFNQLIRALVSGRGLYILKVLFFVSAHAEHRNDGSIVSTNSWFRFIGGLSIQGVDVAAVCPPVSLTQEVLTISADNLKIINTFPYDSYVEFYKGLSRNLFKTLIRYFSQIRLVDVVVFRIPTPGFVAIFIIAKLLNKPLVVFVSGDFYEQSDALILAQGTKKIVYKLFIRTRLFVYAKLLNKNRVRLIYSVSEECNKTYGIGGPRVKLFRTPVFTREQLLNSRNKKRNQSRSHLMLVRACWLLPSKGLEELFEALAIVKSEGYDFHLDLFGSHRDADYLINLKNLIRRLNLQQNVSFLGWVSHDKLIAKFEKYDLHLLSSKAEGMPRVALEMASKKVPQLLTAVGGIPSYFEHLETAYLIKKPTPSLLADGIKWFFKNRRSADLMAVRAYNSLEKYTIEEQSARLIKDLQKQFGENT